MKEVSLMRATRLKSVAVMAITPSHRLTPGIAIAACRARAAGVLDLGIRQAPADIAAALAEFTRAAGSAEHWGIRWDTLGESTKDRARLAQIVGFLATENDLRVRRGEPVQKAFLRDHCFRIRSAERGGNTRVLQRWIQWQAGPARFQYSQNRAHHC